MLDFDNSSKKYQAKEAKKNEDIAHPFLLDSFELFSFTIIFVQIWLGRRTPGRHAPETLGSEIMNNSLACGSANIEKRCVPGVFVSFFVP